MINNDHVAPADLGTAGQLADPGQRSTMATRARYAEVVRDNLRRAAQELSGRPADLVRKRMTLSKLDLGWDESTGEDETRDGAGRESANRGVAPQDTAPDARPRPVCRSHVRGLRWPVHPVADQPDERVRGHLHDPAQPAHRPRQPRPQWTPQEVEEAATLPAARGRRPTT